MLLGAAKVVGGCLPVVSLWCKDLSPRLRSRQDWLLMLFVLLLALLVLAPAFELLCNLPSPPLLIFCVVIVQELFIHDVILEGLPFLIFPSVDYLPFWMKRLFWRLYV